MGPFWGVGGCTAAHSGRLRDLVCLGCGTALRSGRCFWGASLCTQRIQVNPTSSIWDKHRCSHKRCKDCNQPSIINQCGIEKSVSCTGRRWRTWVVVRLSADWLRWHACVAGHDAHRWEEQAARTSAACWPSRPGWPGRAASLRTPGAPLHNSGCTRAAARHTDRLVAVFQKEEQGSELEK